MTHWDEVYAEAVARLVKKLEATAREESKQLSSLSERTVREGIARVAQADRDAFREARQPIKKAS